MDYLELIVGFHRFKEVNPLPASAIALWYELVAVCDKAGWPEEFTYRSEVLQASAGLSRKQFETARQLLIEFELIHYKKSNRVNKAGKYKIISRLLETDNRRSNKTSYTRGNEEGNKPGIVGGHSNNSLSSSTSSSSSPESYYAAHNRVFGFNCNPSQSDQLGAYIDQDGMEEAVVVRAIERAGKASIGYNFNFIQRILDDYFKGGARTLAQAIALDQAFEARKTVPRGEPTEKHTYRKPARSFAELGAEMDGQG